MNNNKHYSTELLENMQCPRCGAVHGQGFSIDSMQCTSCQQHFFLIGDVPCLFPEGINQKILWEHQLGAMVHQAQEGLQSIEASIARYDILASTRQRLIDIYKSSKHNSESITALMQDYDLHIPENAAIDQVNAGDISEYFDLVLRDWAWDNTSQPNTENMSAFDRVNSIIQTLPAVPKKILVMGAGAGRLSWDLHTKFNPTYTIALDSNPLLLAVANRLIHEQVPLSFSEFKNFPQLERDIANVWTLQPPIDKRDVRSTWLPLGANVWQMPFSDEAFDLIITPWFIDVNGGDVRDIIGLISRKLAPNGHWINSGPLLFTRHLPVQLKYTADEIKTLMAYSHFQLNEERIDNTGYLLSPLESRFREEQVWTFSAQKVKSAPPLHSVDKYIFPPPWLAMHHLPIPANELASDNEHPLIQDILAMIDGNICVNDICFYLADKMPDGVDIKDIVTNVLGQMASANNT
jgi:hypothetical protein